VAFDFPPTSSFDAGDIGRMKDLIAAHGRVEGLAADVHRMRAQPLTQPARRFAEFVGGF
jgi:hypothetical protein